MNPARIDVTTPSRAYTVAIEDDAIDRLGGILDEVRAPERRFIVSSPLVWRLHGPRFARAVTGAEPILVPDGERHKQLSTVVRIYDALVARERRSRVDAHHLRGRRHRRHGRLRRGDLPAGHRAGACADHAARAGRQRDRRQGRRQPSARQEPDRRLLSAARGGHRPDGAGDAAAAGVPGGAVRGHQVRHDVERGPFRSVDARAHGDLRARTGRADADHRRIVQHQRPAWCRPTSASRDCGGS